MIKKKSKNQTRAQYNHDIQVKKNIFNAKLDEWRESYNPVLAEWRKYDDIARGSDNPEKIDMARKMKSKINKKLETLKEEKRRIGMEYNPTRAKPKKRYYAVYVDGNTNICLEWSEAESLIKNAKQVKYKKFSKLSEAKNFLSQITGIPSTGSKSYANKSKKSKKYYKGKSKSSGNGWVYAVRKGRRVGIYNTWNACKKQVEGFPYPSFRKFKTRKEAQRFIAE